MRCSINAWCELVAMVVSFLISVIFIVGDKLAWWCVDAAAAQKWMTGFGQEVMILGTHQRLLLTVAVTTIAWVIAAYVAPKTDMNVLIEFYKKVKPFGRGWEPVRKAAGISREEIAATGDNIPMALVGWTCGCAMIWSSLFLVGNIIYGRTLYSVLCGVVFVLSGIVVIKIVNKLWK